MILPKTGDFTLSFYAGFPETLRGEQKILDNGRMLILIDAAGRLAVRFGGATTAALAKRCEGVAAPRVTPEDEALSLRRARSVDPEFADESDYAPLKVVDGQLRTFAEQHDVFAVAVPWDDPAGRDLLCAGSIFGSRPLRYRFLRVERGVPVYAQGVPYEGPDVHGAAVWKCGASAFSLCRDEYSRLVECRRDAKGFGPARPVCRTDGKPVVFSRAHFAFADVDGDGRKEMLVDGNPGTIAVLKGGEPGTWTSAHAFIEGGDVCGETLSSVARIDWDGDGATDIVFGNNASSQRFIEKTIRRRTGSSFYALRNVGNDAEPKFAEAVPMILRKNGKRLDFGWHNSTPWVTDLNGGGKLDLLVSAENGKVYAFGRDEIEIGEIGEWL